MSQFHPHSDAETLERVRARVAEGSGRALVILDLDETLYDAGPRNAAIFAEWVARAESARFPEARDALAALLARASGESAQRMGYSLEDQFRAGGADPDAPEFQKALAPLRAFWTPRFFSSEYLRHDRPYSGAVEFVQGLRAEGARLVYLTGRNAPNMGEGTRRNLERDAFPVESGAEVRLILKARKEIDDHGYKREVGEQLAREAAAAGHSVVAHFENEPRNLVELARAFPEADAVFVDTLCSEHPAEPIRGAYRIRGYR
ncbi:MAG: HAD family hydrolase [Bdellovibrionales bacterium]|nr:HAD family hydrolase [Bdellovibrionales bacterium]